MRKFSKTVGAMVATVGLLAATACSGQQGQGGGEYPSDDATIVVAFGAGGGSDIMARTIADILQSGDLYPRNIMVENREGGSGSSGWGYVASQRGNPYLSAVTSGAFITLPMQADTGWTFEDFTPIALMAEDGMVFLVSQSSGITDWDGWLRSVGNEPVLVGGVSTVGIDFIVQRKLADAFGYEIEYVPFNDEGQLQTALTSGSIDAIVANPGTILGQVEAGAMVPLVFAGDAVPEGFPAIPTAADLGVDDMPALPRGFVMPGDLEPDVEQFWVDAMRKVVESDEWQSYRSSNFLTGEPEFGEDFQSYLVEIDEQFRTTLTEAGVL